MASEQSPNRLLVEGQDDQFSIIHLLERHDFDWARPEAPWVQKTNGLEPLLRALPVALKTYRRLGVVLDANSSPRHRWQRLASAARRDGVEIGEILPQGSQSPGILPAGRVGIWLMPDNTSTGALEDFLAEMIPADDPCWAYAGEVTAEARSRGARCPEKHHLKSRLHTWLAWQEEPGNPFGTAMKAQVFQSDGDLAQRFVSWFRRLFVDP
jgi:hypothetical protein